MKIFIGSDRKSAFSATTRLRLDYLRPLINNECSYSVPLATGNSLLEAMNCDDIKRSVKVIYENVEGAFLIFQVLDIDVARNK